MNERAVLVVLAGFCKQQLDVFSMDVAVENEVVKVPVEGECTQSLVVAEASASWENCVQVHRVGNTW